MTKSSLQYFCSINRLSSSPLMALSLFLILSSATMALAQATAGIPLPGSNRAVKKAASDILSAQGKLLDPNELSAQVQNGFDSSSLNPQDNKLWQNKSYSAQNRKDISPNGIGAQSFNEFIFVSEGAALPGRATFYQVKSASGEIYRLGITNFGQATMMRAALLRKLGYSINSPRYYNNVKISFKDKEQKDLFLTDAQSDISVDFASRKWVISETDTSVSLSSAVIEKFDENTQDLYWGLGSDESRKELFAISRAYRALLLPNALVDVPESINRFSPRFTNVVKGYATIQYIFAESFSDIDYDDARWILKRMSRLSLSDWREIAAESSYPAELLPLIEAKLIARLNSALRTFNLPTSLPTPNLVSINSSSGLVTRGKVTAEFIAGVPQRISHPVDSSSASVDLRQSPFQDSDIGRYLSLISKTTVVQTAAQRFSDKLQGTQIQDLAQDYSQKRFQKIISHIQNTPNEPFFEEVTSWGGIISGANVNASRFVSTGTFSGSTAPFQLVDNLSLSAGLGVFQALDGLDSWTPASGANVSVVRDYTHVRPITSMREGNKEDWSKLVVPRFMNSLSKTLKTEMKTTAEGTEVSTLDDFLANLRDGEVFTVTDSVSLTAYLQASASIDVLLGISPINFVNSVTLGADASRVILKQVSFTRTSEGVQVFVREMKNRGLGLELGLNFFVNLIKLRSELTDSQIRSDAFIIDYSPQAAAADPNSILTLTEGADSKDTNVEIKQNLRLVVPSLLRDNNTELLYSKFAPRKFQITQDIRSKETKLKFLAWRFGSFVEKKKIAIEYPKNPDFPDLNPAEQKILLYSSKKGEIAGRDLLGLSFDVIDSTLVRNSINVKMPRSFGENPANVPFGRAHWKMITTEADVTQFRPQLPSVTLVDYVWGGWKLPQKKFFKVIDEVEALFANLTASGDHLINQNDFYQATSLDFYRINARVTLTSTGLERIKTLLLPEDSRLDRRAQELRAFSEIIRLMGNGDLQAGTAQYYRQCERSAQYKSSEDSMLRGNEYGCLSGWMRRLLNKINSYPADKQRQTDWLTETLFLLEKEVPISNILKKIGPEGYIAFVRINGFRPGDEDGDLEFFSNTLGDPRLEHPEANGLINLYNRKTRILPLELERTNGSFQ